MSVKCLSHIVQSVKQREEKTQNNPLLMPFFLPFKFRNIVGVTRIAVILALNGKRQFSYTIIIVVINEFFFTYRMFRNFMQNLGDRKQR